MKLTAQTIAGFAVGIVIAAAAILILRPPPSTIYNSFRVNGDILRTLYNNSNFARIGFNFVNTGSNKIEFIPAIYNTSGGIMAVPAGLIRSLGTGHSISGIRILDGHLYNLEHNKLPNHLLQLQTLLSIMTINSGGYLDFIPQEFNKVDPADTTHIFYTITAYTSKGVLIRIANNQINAMQLNPCPPGHQY